MSSNAEQKARSRNDDSGRSESEADVGDHGLDIMEEDSQGGDTGEDTEDDIKISRAKGVASDVAVIKCKSA